MNKNIPLPFDTKMRTFVLYSSIAIVVISVVIFHMLAKLFGLYDSYSVYEIIDLSLSLFVLITLLEFIFIKLADKNRKALQEIAYGFSKHVFRIILFLVALFPIVHLFLSQKYGLFFPFFGSNSAWFDTFRFIIFKAAGILALVFLWFYVVPRQGLTFFNPTVSNSFLATYQPEPESAFSDLGDYAEDSSRTLSSSHSDAKKTTSTMASENKQDKDQESARKYQEPSKSALEDFMDIEELPPEEQQKLKMQKHVINYMAEKPEDVASIIKYWLANGDDTRREPPPAPPEYKDKPDQPQHEMPPEPDFSSEDLAEEEAESAYDSIIADDPASLRDAYLNRGERERETVYLQAFQGSFNAQTVLAELAMRGNGHAVTAILRANLLENNPIRNLWRSDAHLISKMAHSLSKEYPNDEAVTTFVKGMINHRLEHFSAYLMNALIRYHKASIIYPPALGNHPVILTEHRKDEYENNPAAKSHDLNNDQPPENTTNTETNTENNNQIHVSYDEALPLKDLSRVIAMLFIYTPETAQTYFGSVYDPLLKRESPLFETWTNDPIVADAFCMQIQSAPGMRQHGLQLVEQAIRSNKLDIKAFDYSQFPGFVEDILSTLAVHHDHVREFMQNLTTDNHHE